jgi:hypothetical protein
MGQTWGKPSTGAGFGRICSREFFKERKCEI